MSGDGFEYCCDYCRIPFCSDIHIQCADCRDIRLCLKCFSYGKELPPHKNNHNYYVVEYITKRIYDTSPNDDAKWSGHEDILLLDGIEKYGLGNWKQIALHIGNNKTPKQTELHYLQIYCNQNNSDDDDDNDDDDDDDDDEEDSDIIDDVNTNNNSSKCKKKRISSKALKPKSKNQINLNGYTNPTSYIAGTRSIHQYVNYYPYRHEFDSEHQEYAELLISDLTSSDLRDNKNNINYTNNIKQYDGILKMRNMIKNFILDRKLFLFYDKKNNRTSRKQTSYCSYNNGDDDKPNEQQIKKLLVDKLQPFCKYFPSTEEYLKFIETDAIIQCQRMNINRYIEYREKYGCRTMEDIKLIQAVKTQSKNKNKWDKFYNNTTYYNNNNNNHRQRNKRRQRNNRNNNRRKLQIDDSDDDDDEDDDDDDDSDYNGHLFVNHNNNDSSINNNNNNKEPALKKRKLMLDSLNNKFTEKMVDVNGDNNNDGIEHSDYSSHSSQPSYLLLSLAERDFISHLKILPNQYMQYKNILLMENVRNGYVDKKQIKKYLPHFTNQRCDDFCDFFDRLKWIQLSP